MAITLSVYRVSLFGDVVEEVEGGGSLLQDALDLGTALGRVHPGATRALDRVMNAPGAAFEPGDLPVLLGLLADLHTALPTCADRWHAPIPPGSDALVAWHVCTVEFGRLVLRRTGHDLRRVLEDLVPVSELLSRALGGGGHVVCDFATPDRAHRGDT